MDYQITLTVTVDLRTTRLQATSHREALAKALAELDLDDLFERCGGLARRVEWTQYGEEVRRAAVDVVDEDGQYDENETELFYGEALSATPPGRLYLVHVVFPATPDESTCLVVPGSQDPWPQVERVVRELLGPPVWVPEDGAGACVMTFWQVTPAGVVYDGRTGQEVARFAYREVEVPGWQIEAWADVPVAPLPGPRQ